MIEWVLIVCMGVSERANEGVGEYKSVGPIN